jgi:hypothetical protein
VAVAEVEFAAVFRFYGYLVESLLQWPSVLCASKPKTPGEGNSRSLALQADDFSYFEIAIR